MYVELTSKPDVRVNCQEMAKRENWTPQEGSILVR